MHLPWVERSIRVHIKKNILTWQVRDDIDHCQK